MKGGLLLARVGHKRGWLWDPNLVLIVLIVELVDLRILGIIALCCLR